MLDILMTCLYGSVYCSQVWKLGVMHWMRLQMLVLVVVGIARLRHHGRFYLVWQLGFPSCEWHTLALQY